MGTVWQAKGLEVEHHHGDTSDAVCRQLVIKGHAKQYNKGDHSIAEVSSRAVGGRF